MTWFVVASSRAEGHAASDIQSILWPNAGGGVDFAARSTRAISKLRVRKATVAQTTANSAYPPDHIHACARLVRFGSTRTGYVSRPAIDPRLESAKNR